MGVYEDFFGLREEPFRLTPDPRFLFLSAKHREVLAHLRLGMTESGGFVCITGDVGTGKTTLVRTFLGQLEAGTAVAYIFNPLLSPPEFLQAINAELGLPAVTTSRKTLIDDLNAYLLAQRRADRRVLVVVDEAQALGADVLEQLRLLSNLETTTEKLLQIVLIGQPQLAEVLGRGELAQLNQRITLRWHLGPLDAEESAAYVRHRLRVAANGAERAIFTRRAIAHVHAYAGGVPRLINIFCHRALLAAYAAEQRRVTARTVHRVYGEIQRVPLPARRPPRAARVRRALTWATGGTALAAALGWALVRMDPAFVTAYLDGVPARAPWPAVEPPRGAGGDDGATAGADRLAVMTAGPVDVIEDAAAPRAAGPGAGPDETGADAGRPIPGGENPGAAGGPATAAGATAPAVGPGDVSGAGEGDAIAAVAREPAAVLGADEAARLLLDDAARASASAAVEVLLRRWEVPPLGASEAGDRIYLGTLAGRRGLRHLQVAGTLGMLRVLDLPAILEMVIPGAPGPRYVVFTGAGEEDECLLAVGERDLRVERRFLDEHWLGRADLFWRDFEELGSTLAKGSAGPAVLRLQRMLARLGLYGGPMTGVFDDGTEATVVTFQRGRRLFADGRVGPLTSIVLYDAIPGYAQPRLVDEPRRRAAGA
jgi:general secretion pathway protein A